MARSGSGCGGNGRCEAETVSCEACAGLGLGRGSSGRVAWCWGAVFHCHHISSIDPQPPQLFSSRFRPGRDLRPPEAGRSRAPCAGPTRRPTQPSIFSPSQSAWDRSRPASKPRVGAESRRSGEARGAKDVSDLDQIKRLRVV